MQHNLEQYHKQLLLSCFYVAHSHYEQGTKWQSDWTGHMLADRLMLGNAVASIIEHVLNFCLNCGATSHYFKHGVGSLVGAKFQFLLSKPEKTPFAADFDKVLDHFEHIQAAFASIQS